MLKAGLMKMPFRRSWRWNPVLLGCHAQRDLYNNPEETRHQRSAHPLLNGNTTSQRVEQSPTQKLGPKVIAVTNIQKKIVGVSQPKKILRLMGSGDGSAGVENKWWLFFLRETVCRIQTSLFSEFLPLYRHTCSGPVWCWLCHDLREKTSLLPRPLILRASVDIRNIITNCKRFYNQWLFKTAALFPTLCNWPMRCRFILRRTRTTFEVRFKKRGLYMVMFNWRREPWSLLNTRVGNSSSQLHQLLFWQNGPARKEIHAIDAQHHDGPLVSHLVGLYSHARSSWKSQTVQELLPC